jgi:MFS family permease
LRHVFRALRHRNYQLFFSGQLISLIGTWMQTVAESWLVYRLTGSAALLGVTAFCSQIPVFLLAPIGGIVADRYPKRLVMVTTQSISMVLPLILSTLTFTGLVRVWHVFVLASCLGIVNAFDVPARQALVVELVGREDLQNGIALNSSIFNGARVIGPGVAGVLVAAVGEAWCFLLNGISYLAVIAGLLLMRVDETYHERATSPFRSVLDGWSFVARTAPVRALLLQIGILSLTGMPFVVLMPIFADEILHGGARGLGLLMSASGVGALGAALTLAGRRSVRGLSMWVARAAAGFGIALALFSLSRQFWLSVVLLVPVGYSMMVALASSNTLIQSMVPNTLRGRVMSVYSMMLMGMAPFGGLSAGYAAERIGAPATVAIGGAICLITATVFRLRLPKMRDQARQLILAQGMIDEESPPPPDIIGPVQEVPLEP